MMPGRDVGAEMRLCDGVLVRWPTTSDGGGGGQSARSLIEQASTPSTPATGDRACDAGAAPWGEEERR